MTTQNRYYSNLSQGSFITNVGGISSSNTVITVQATANWPTQFPFTVRIEPGTANEEVVLISSGAGTSSSPYIAQALSVSGRGFDGTNPLSHSQGAAIIPGFSQLDFAQPQQHITLTGSTSGAHGLPANAWSGGTMQLLESAVAPASGPVVLNSFSTSGFNHLRLVYALLGNGTGGLVQNGVDLIEMQINGSTSSANTAGTRNNVSSSSVQSLTGISTTGTPTAGLLWNANFTSTNPSAKGIIDIPWYAGNNTKTFLSNSYASDGGSTGTQATVAGTYQSSTAPISSISIIAAGNSSAFTAGEVWLYGIN